MTENEIRLSEKEEIYFDVTRVFLSLSTFVTYHLAAEKIKNYLFFGASRDELVPTLGKQGWVGIRTVNKPDSEVYNHETLIVATIATDPRIIKTLSKWWTRSLTVNEIYRQFPGPYSAIGAIDTNMDRELWYHPSIQASLPKVYMIGEDGHNEDVIRIARERGYNPFICDKTLVLVHR